MSFEEAFRGHHDQLQQYLDIRSGLLTKLRDMQVITREQLEEIDHVSSLNSVE